MIKLKPTIGALQVGAVKVTQKTDEKTIKRIINKRPYLKVYFDGLKKPKKNNGKSSKST